MKKILLTISTFLIFTMATSAKEAYFQAIIQDILPQPGPEIISSNQDGSLSILDSQGKLIKNLVFDNAVASSNPVIINNQAAVIIRTTDTYQFAKINQDFSAIEQSWDITNSTPSDPLIFENLAIFLRENGQLVSLDTTTGQTNIVQNLQQTGELSLTENGFIISYPNLAQIDIFTVEANQINQSSTIQLATPQIYKTITHNNLYYGINSLGQLTSFNQNGQLQNNFPIDLPSLPITSPLITENQIIIELFHGQTLAFDLNGNQITQLADHPLNQQITLSSHNNKLYQNIRNFLALSTENQSITMASIFSRFSLNLQTAAQTSELISEGNIQSPLINNWRPYGTPDTFEIREEENNNQYLFVEKLNGSTGASYNNLNLQANTTYTLTFNYKFTGERFRTLINQPSLGSNTDFQNIYRNEPHSNQWTSYSRTFTTSPDLNEDMRIFFTIRNGSLSIDNLSLTPTPTPPTKIINDGDMEEALTNSWRQYGTPDTFEIREEEQNKYLLIEKLIGGSGASYNNLNLQANTTYTLTFNYKFTGERFRTLINQRSLGNNTDFQNIYRNEAKGNEQWLEYSRTFTTNPDLNEDMRIFFTFRNGVLQLDNVQLVE